MTAPERAPLPVGCKPLTGKQRQQYVYDAEDAPSSGGLGEWRRQGIIRFEATLRAAEDEARRLRDFAEFVSMALSLYDWDHGDETFRMPTSAAKALYEAASAALAPKPEASDA